MKSIIFQLAYSSASTLLRLYNLNKCAFPEFRFNPGSRQRVAKNTSSSKNKNKRIDPELC